MPVRKSALVAFSLLFGASVQAQYIPSFQPAMDINVAGSIYLGDEAAGGKNSYRSRPSSPENPIIPLTYTPSKSRTRTNLQTFVNKSRAADPAGAAQMEQEFASGDIMGQIGGIMSSVGLSKNNVADAFALYWVNAWQVANGDSSTPSAETMQAVAAQAARGLSQSPEFAAADDAQKQEMAEALMVQGVMIASAYEQSAGNKTQLKAIGDAVAKGADASGLKLYEMTLTENGFVPAKARKRSDASDAAGEERALAANDAGDDKDAGLSATQLAMIAAAGGAGLGAVFLLGKVAGKKG
jgi:hypothetical protein